MRNYILLKSFTRKYPALVTALPLCLGILTAYFSGINLSSYPAYLFIILLVLSGVILIFLYKSVRLSNYYLLIYSALLILFGLFSFQCKYFIADENIISGLFNDTREIKTLIRGVVSERPEVNNDRIRFMLSGISINDKSYSGEILASVYKNRFKNESLKEYKYGDVLEINGKLEALPRSKNPGEFDYGEYLRLHDVDAMFISFGYENISLTGSDPPGFYKGSILIPVKDYCVKIIDKFIGGDEGEYLKGLVLGERSNISREVKQNFINAGVAHIIAVSGLNVAYVIIVIWGLLVFIPVKHTYKILITIILLVFYMNLTGNTPSIIRATIMASIFLLAQLFERKPDSINITSFSALVILLINPAQLFDAGFILSFSAIFSLILIYPVFNRWLGLIEWYKNPGQDNLFIKAVKGLIILFTGTLAAQIGTLPVTAIMFKKISVVSLLANLFAIPLSNVALGLGFIMIIVSPVSVWLASVFASVNSLLLYLQLFLIEFCAGLDYAYFETYFADSLLLFVYFTVLILLVTSNIKNYRFRLLLCAVLISNYVIWKDVYNKTPYAEITYLSLGNSNSTLIKMPLGSSVLINAGSSGNNFTSAQRNIIPYLKAKNISQLDLLVINTLNRNEFKSLKYLVDNFPVNKLVVPVYYKPVFENKNLRESFDHVNIEYIENSKIINSKGNFRIYLYYDSLYRSSTMISQFSFGSQNFLFNDVKQEKENVLFEYLIDNSFKYRVYKTSGSGSFSVNSPAIITAADPEFIVISAAGNSRSSVNTEIFTETLQNNGYNVLNTPVSGAMIFKTNGAETKLIEWR